MTTHLGIHGFVAGLPCVQTIDVAVVHAERSGDQHRVMDFEIGCAEGASLGYVFGGDALAALLHFACDCEQRLELGGDCRFLKICLYLLHGFRATEVTGGSRSMSCLAEVTIVLRRDIRSDQLALARCEASGLMQQNVRKLA